MTKHQPSITEWLAQIGEMEKSSDFRDEDNKKADRMEFLYQNIGFSYERPDKFEATDLTNKTPVFMKVLEERGEELCAIRLVPKKPSLTKLRNRGLSIRECYETWYLKQNINPEDYLAYVCPHVSGLLWSSIFVVNQEAIFGEIIQGMHMQLTHGDTENTSYQFRYDFTNWVWSEENPEAQKQIKKMLVFIYVTDKNKQAIITQELKMEFSHNYLTGYFEALVRPDNDVYYTDYNRMLIKFISTPPAQVFDSKTTNNKALQGRTAFPGAVTGQVVIVKPEMIDKVDFPKGAILVCDNTDIRFLPLMRLSGAIVTNRGGILSHAAIIARELTKPCIINTKAATELLKNGDKVKVDAEKGTVEIL